MHRGAVQQGGGEGDLREPTRDGENLKGCITSPGVGTVRRKHLAWKDQIISYENVFIASLLSPRSHLL